LRGSSSTSSEVILVMTAWSFRGISRPLHASTRKLAQSMSETSTSVPLEFRVIPLEPPAVGGCVSRTVAVKLHAAGLPAPSLAEQVTVVSPSGSFTPEGEQVTVLLPEQLSWTFAVNVPTAPSFTHSRYWWLGHAIVGGVLSATLTTDEQTPWRFPSSAMRFTIVFPRG